MGPGISHRKTQSLGGWGTSSEKRESNFKLCKADRSIGNFGALGESYTQQKPDRRHKGFAARRWIEHNQKFGIQESSLQKFYAETAVSPRSPDQSKGGHLTGTRPDPSQPTSDSKPPNFANETDTGSLSITKSDLLGKTEPPSLYPISQFQNFIKDAKSKPYQSSIINPNLATPKNPKTSGPITSKSFTMTNHRPGFPSAPSDPADPSHYLPCPTRIPNSPKKAQNNISLSTPNLLDSPNTAPKLMRHT
jgi:hypothetical protein